MSKPRRVGRATSSACDSRMPASASLSAPARCARRARARAGSAAGRECWPPRYRRAAAQGVPAASRCSSTLLRARIVAVPSRRACGSTSTRVDPRRRRASRRRWPIYRSRSRNRGPASPPLILLSRKPSTSCVVGCLPVPKARPGSRRTAMRIGRRLAPARSDPQALADLDRRELRLAAAHPVLVGDLTPPYAAAWRRARRTLAAARRQACGSSCRSTSAHKVALGSPGWSIDDRLRAGFEQRVARALGRAGLDLQREREPRHYFFFFCSWASFCSR